MELGADVIIGVHLLVQAASSQPLPQPLNPLCSIVQVLCRGQNDRSGAGAKGGGGEVCSQDMIV